MITQESVIELVNDILQGSDKFLVEVIIQAGNKITVFFDSDSSVSIADCQHLNRELESRLDRDREDFELTVSSAGMDRPLKLIRQFQKRVGKGFDLITTSGEKMTGTLVKISGDTLEFEHPVKNLKKEIKKPNTQLSLNQLKSAKIVITIGK